MLQALRCCCPRNQAADEKAALAALGRKPEDPVDAAEEPSSRPVTPRKGILKRPKDRVITPRPDSQNSSLDVMDELHAYRSSVGDISALRRSSVLSASDVSARLEEISRQSKIVGNGGLASSLRNSDEFGMRPASFRSSTGTTFSQHSTPRNSIRDVESMDGESPRNTLLAYDSSLHNLVDALFVFCPMAEWSQALHTGILEPRLQGTANDGMRPHFLCLSFTGACKRARELMMASKNGAAAGSEAVVLEIDGRLIKAPMIFSRIGETRVVILMGEINPSAVVCVHSLLKFFEALSDETK